MGSADRCPSRGKCGQNHPIRTSRGAKPADFLGPSHSGAQPETPEGARAEVIVVTEIEENREFGTISINED
jgi:hypothetical protein